jgi:hypothetical protein
VLSTGLAGRLTSSPTRFQSAHRSRAFESRTVNSSPLGRKTEPVVKSLAVLGDQAPMRGCLKTTDWYDDSTLLRFQTRDDFHFLCSPRRSQGTTAACLLACYLRFAAYFASYHRARTHLSLKTHAPDARPIEPPGLGTIVTLSKSVASMITPSDPRRSPAPPGLPPTAPVSA